MSLPMFSHASKLHFIKKWSKLKGTMFEIFHHLFLKIARKGVKNVLRMTNDIEGFFETAFPSLTRSAEESFVCQIMAP